MAATDPDQTTPGPGGIEEVTAGGQVPETAIDRDIATAPANPARYARSAAASDAGGTRLDGDRLAVSQSAKSVHAGEYKHFFRHHAAGVAVVTVGSGSPYGLTVTSLTSVSADPPVAAFSIGADASAWPMVADQDNVVINVLAEDQAAVSRQFATRGVDRFAGVRWSRLSTGEPVIDGTHAWMRGEISGRIPVGSSFLITVEVDQVVVDADRAPLVFYDRQHYRLGHHHEPGTD